MNKLFLSLMLLISLPTFSQEWTEQYNRLAESIELPQIADAEYDITAFGAKESATPAANQRAINKAILTCSEKGGGRVIVPEGIYQTGAIRMRSGVNLVVNDGATLLFYFPFTGKNTGKDSDLYPIVETRWEGLDCWNLSPCIYADSCHDIAISGTGTIDGGGTNETWWPWCGNERFGYKETMTVSQKLGSRSRLQALAENGAETADRRFSAADGLRPQLINFRCSERILIQDVTLLRSPFWVIHPLLSKNITVRGVKIFNEGPNGDGCDPESCSSVLIENCYFHTGDDCIAIKSGRNEDGRRTPRPSENIIVRGCTMEDGHGGIVIGSEISAGCRNVFVEDCVMDSPDLDRVVRIKTNTCRGGVVENIFARNIKVGQCNESVMRINLNYEPKEECHRGFIPTVRNVRLYNITCEKSKYGILINALSPDTCVSDIYVENCRFNGVTKKPIQIEGSTRGLIFADLKINGEDYSTKFSRWLTESEIKRVPKAYLLDFSKRPKWSYVIGIELEAMLDTYLRYGDKKILNYCREYIDTMISDKGDIRSYNLKDYNLDQVRTGHFVARMQQLEPREKTLKAIKTLYKQLQKQPRTKEGIWWHKAIYANQVWLDGIFMGLPFYVLSTPILGKKTDKIYNDALRQVSRTYALTLDSMTGLNRHAWDETHSMFWADRNTGLSAHTWSRAQGWMAMAILELCETMPEDAPQRAQLTDILRKVMTGVVKYQDKETGLWRQVMDCPDSIGNYFEATASSMFAYVLLKGSRLSLFTDSAMLRAGRKAFYGIVDNLIRVNPDNTISLTQCCSVAGLGPDKDRRRDGSYKYYISEPIRDNDAKGVGPFIWAALEIERD